MAAAEYYFLRLSPGELCFQDISLPYQTAITLNSLNLMGDCHLITSPAL